MQPYPRSPDLVWPGHLHGTGCLSARAMDTGFPTVVWRLCLGLGCGWAWVSAAPRHSWLGCWGVCVFACALRLYPATPGWGVRCGCVCLGSGFGCAPPLLAGVLGPVCACVRAPLVPRHSLLGCAVWVCVFGLRFWLRPATPGWGVGVCVCLCACSACTLPLLAGVCGAGVCAWARVLAAPRDSWLGCLGLCVLVCAPRLYPATPCWGVQCGCVCLGSGFGCALPLLAGVLGPVCACVAAPPVPCHSWLGCVVWVCVLGLAFRLRPATPGWGVGACVCLCARSACTPRLLAGVCGVGVCAGARVSATPRHSWLGCWGACVLVRARLVPRHSWLGCVVWVCVLGLGFRLPPATPGWGVGMCVWLCARSACTMALAARLCGVGACAGARVSAVPRHSWLGCWGVCVCLCARSACTPPLLAGVCGLGVCAWARVSAAPRHSWLGCWGVCVLGACSACTPPLLAGVCGVDVCVLPRVVAALRHSWLGCWGVRVCVRALLVPRHSWLGCVVWVCVLGLGFPLRPATPRWGAGVRVCLCARSACTPPLLAGLCAVGVCAWARVLAAPRHSWLGCSGVCVCLCAHPACTMPLVARLCGVGACAGARVSAAPRHSWLGCWGVCVLVCALRLYPATPGWGVRLGCLCLGSCFGCAPPLLAGLLGCVCACCALRLCPATPGWGVRCERVCLGSGCGCSPPLLPGVLGCACLCARSACTLPLLAGVCSVGVCAWARVRAAHRHFWLGCWGACVLVCALHLYPATPGWAVRCGCVCLGSGCGCSPPLLAGVLGCVCACVRTPVVPRHSWLGCALWVCVLGLGFRLRPATPGLGCWGVCVFVCALGLYHATLGSVVRCGCVCWGSGLGCAPPLLAGVLGCVCACVRAPLVPHHP